MILSAAALILVSVLFALLGGVHRRASLVRAIMSAIASLCRRAEGAKLRSSQSARRSLSSQFGKEVSA
eukprot:366395-Chlamydomonas_euryale.AAC.6